MTMRIGQSLSQLLLSWYTLGFIILGGLTIVSFSTNRNLAFNTIFLSLTFVASLILFFTFFNLRRNIITRIEAHPAGLRVQLNKQSQQLRWIEMRAFACYKPMLANWPAFRKLKFSSYYEISTASLDGDVMVIRWQFPPYRLVSLSPKMDRTSYEQFSEQLVSLIHAQTGLPLLHFDDQR